MIARTMRPAAMIVILAVVLAGCGPMPEPTPPPPTAPSVPTAPGEQASPAATAVAKPTLGSLAAEIAAAWPSVTSYRMVRTGSTMLAPTAAASPATGVVATPVASSAATPVIAARASYAAIRDVILPDRQRLEVTGLGPQDFEAISDSSGIYLHGPAAVQVDANASPDAWLRLDPTSVPPGSVMATLLGGMPGLPAAPLASLPERLLPQELRDLGTTEFEGRTCQIYGAADTVPATGMRVDFMIAVDADSIPCFIETKTGTTVQGRDEYQQINAVTEISSPAQATPVSLPDALASPAAHD